MYYKLLRGYFISYSNFKVELKIYFTHCFDLCLKIVLLLLPYRLAVLHNVYSYFCQQKIESKKNVNQDLICEIE